MADGEHILQSFDQSGLIVAAQPDQELLVQGNRRIVRAKRRDRLTDPLATSASGWEVFPAKAISI
jgi:hypothetical protein